VICMQFARYALQLVQKMAHVNLNCFEFGCALAGFIKADLCVIAAQGPNFHDILIFIELLISYTETVGDLVCH
jgi:hypothetical protein